MAAGKRSLSSDSTSQNDNNKNADAATLLRFSSCIIGRRSGTIFGRAAGHKIRFNATTATSPQTVTQLYIDGT